MKFGRSRTLLETCRPSVALSELSTILKESCDTAGIGFHEGYWSESESSLDEVLDRHEMIGGRIFRLYGDRLQRTLHNDIRYYDTGCFVISRVHLLLDSEDWTSFLPLTGLFFHGLYLEECIVEVPTGGRDLIAFSFAPNVVFRQTEFVNSFRNKDTPPDLPPAGWGPLSSTWIMNFRHHATVVFEGCRFGCDDVQISALYPPIEDEVEVVDPHDGKRQVLRKSTPSDATPTETPSPSVSGLAYVLANASSDSVAKMGLAHLEFVACRGIRTLHLVSATRELILRGRNEIESILLPYDERFWTSLRMYMGLSEVIDAKFQDPARHRHLFLRLKSLASSTEDQSLLRASTAQIQRIEHFLIKEDTAAISGGVGLIVDHWQRRAVLAWGIGSRTSTDLGLGVSLFSCHSMVSQHCSHAPSFIRILRAPIPCQSSSGLSTRFPSCLKQSRII